MTAITRVVGIDPSLTCTGIVSTTATGLTIATSVPSKPEADADWHQRGDRITRVIDHVLQWVEPGDLVVIESNAPSRGSQRGTWDRAGMWWGLWSRLRPVAAAVVAVSPGTRAKWATGKGNAQKALVVAAIARLCVLTIDSDDIADAAALALMGAQHLSWRPDLDTKYRSEALAAVTWPDLGDING